MKVTVTKFLNVRVGAPNTSADCYQYLAPGSTIEVDDDPVTGAPYEQNSRWYRDRANNYYWSGGLSIPAKADSAALSYDSSQLDWYHSEYKITDIWEQFGTQGQGATVAVIDSGIDKTNKYFQTAVIEGTDYVNGGSPVVVDNNGHGTEVASIIIANGPGMIGVAPKATVFAAKVFDTGSPTADSIAAVINKLPSEIRTVVISNSFRRHDFAVSLEKVFKDSDKIFVCAAGNDGQTQTLNKFPASIQSPNVLSVAATSRGQVICPISTLSAFIAIAAPGGRVKNISPALQGNNPNVSDGTSYAAPFVAGVFALMESVMITSGKFLTNQELIKIMLDSVTPVAAPSPSPFGKGIINPLQAIKNLQKKLA